MSNDNINPDHYKAGKVECIDALEAATIGKSGFEGACVANVIKYLWRYERKAGLEDVKKAQWYLNKLIEHLEVDVFVKIKVGDKFVCNKIFNGFNPGQLCEAPLENCLEDSTGIYNFTGMLKNEFLKYFKAL